MSRHSLCARGVLRPASASDCPFTGDEPEFKNIAFASFNSLEASLTKQNGDNRILETPTSLLPILTATASITHPGSATGFAGAGLQPRVFRASSDFDVRNRIIFSGGWTCL